MDERRRRLAVILISALIIVAGAAYQSMRPVPEHGITQSVNTVTPTGVVASEAAKKVLDTLEIKGRAPKTDYRRSQFGQGWSELDACDIRNHILKRDLTNVVTKSDTDCTVLAGLLDDPYTSKKISFMRGEGTSDDVQIDHVVALSDAWQKGAQQLTAKERVSFANDPLNLLAVDGEANTNKSDSDAASWLPPNKDYRCRYVARQIAVKTKYRLWITSAEHDAMERVLATCPDQRLPITT